MKKIFYLPFILLSITASVQASRNLNEEEVTITELNDGKPVTTAISQEVFNSYMQTHNPRIEDPNFSVGVYGSTVQGETFALKFLTNTHDAQKPKGLVVYLPGFSGVAEDSIAYARELLPAGYDVLAVSMTLNGCSQARVINPTYPCDLEWMHRFPNLAATLKYRGPISAIAKAPAADIGYILNQTFALKNAGGKTVTVTPAHYTTVVALGESSGGWQALEAQANLVKHIDGTRAFDAFVLNDTMAQGPIPPFPHTPFKALKTMDEHHRPAVALLFRSNRPGGYGTLSQTAAEEILEACSPESRIVTADPYRHIGMPFNGREPEGDDKVKGGRNIFGGETTKFLTELSQRLPQSNNP